MFGSERFHLLESQVSDSCRVFYFSLARILENTNFVPPDNESPIVLVSYRKLRILLPGGFESVEVFILILLRLAVLLDFFL